MGKATSWLAPVTWVLLYTHTVGRFRDRQALARDVIMASLLPLLSDLLPMIIPSEVRIVRRGELVTVEERAERPPWYPQQRPAAKGPSGTTLASRTGVDGDKWSSEPSGSESGDLEPIKLLDLGHEDHHPATAVITRAQQGTSVGAPPQLDGQNPVPSEQTSRPKVFRQDALVGVTDRMCVTGKPTRILSCYLNLFRPWVYFNMRLLSS